MFCVWAGGFLAEGLGPETIAMAVVGSAVQAEVACGGSDLLDGVEVFAELWVNGDAECEGFKVAAEAESELLFDGRGYCDWLDFAAELELCIFSELLAVTVFVDAGASELWEFEQAVEVVLGDVEWGLVEFEAEAVVHDAVDFGSDVDDAEVVVAGGIEAEVELLVEG